MSLTLVVWAIGCSTQNRKESVNVDCGNQKTCGPSIRTLPTGLLQWWVMREMVGGEKDDERRFAEL